MDLQIIGKNRIARQIGDQSEGCGCNHHRHNRQAVQTIGEVDRIARRHNHKTAKGKEENAEIKHHFLEEGKGQTGGQTRRSDTRHRDTGHHRNHKFQHQTRFAGKAFMALLGDFEIIIIKADQPEAQGHRHDNPDIGIERIGP